MKGHTYSKRTRQQSAIAFIEQATRDQPHKRGQNVLAFEVCAVLAGPTRMAYGKRGKFQPVTVPRHVRAIARSMRLWSHV